MDFSFIESLIPNVAVWLHLQPETVLLLLGVLVSVCNLLSRWIPDDAVGTLKWVRLVAKFIGMNVPSRITKGITINDVARAVVDDVSTNVLRDAQASRGVMPEVLELTSPAFPGLVDGQVTGPDGHFVKREPGSSI